jgi:hypothetical protein
MASPAHEQQSNTASDHGLDQSFKRPPFLEARFCTRFTKKRLLPKESFFENCSLYFLFTV